MATYSYSTITYSASTLSSPTVLALSDDSASAAITIGFTYNFYGIDYTTLYVGSNGLVTFGAARSNAVTTLGPNSGYPYAVLAGSDLVPSGSIQPKYQLLGTSPNRIFVVDFTSIPFYDSNTGNASTSVFATFQIKLYETTNIAEIHISSFDPAALSAPAGWIGVTNANATDKTTPYSTNSINASNIAYRFSSALAPVAGFTATPLSGAAPLTVNFTDTSTNAPTSWSWTFGDGGTDTVQNPSYVYSTPGTYSVTLTASNGSGSNGMTQTNYITVTAAPVGIAWVTL